MEAGLDGHVREGAVAVVSVEEVGRRLDHLATLGAETLDDVARALWQRVADEVLDRVVVDDEQVEKAVEIVVEPDRRGALRVGAGDPGLDRHVGEEVTVVAEELVRAGALEAAHGHVEVGVAVVVVVARGAAPVEGLAADVRELGDVLEAVAEVAVERVRPVAVRLEDVDEAVTVEVEDGRPTTGALVVHPLLDRHVDVERLRGGGDRERASGDQQGAGAEGGAEEVAPEATELKQSHLVS